MPFCKFGGHRPTEACFMLIRRATENDKSAIWSIIGPAIRAGETYALAREMSEAEALSYWMGPDRETFVAVEDRRILGTYYLRSNQAGGGDHVANCGYMTDPVGGPLNINPYFLPKTGQVAVVSWRL